MYTKININKKLNQKLKIYAAAKGEKMQDVVDKAVKQYLLKKGGIK